MPYQKLYINLLESFVLADLVVLLIIASTEQFKVSSCLHNDCYQYGVTVMMLDLNLPACDLSYS